MTTTIRNAEARRRLWRRAVAVLVEHEAEADRDITRWRDRLDHAADSLGERGLAATADRLDEAVRDTLVEADLERGGYVGTHLDVGRFYGTEEEAREWLLNRLDTNLRAIERRVCGR